jgi:hypothetical protein
MGESQFSEAAAAAIGCGRKFADVTREAHVSACTIYAWKAMRRGLI